MTDAAGQEHLTPAKVETVEVVVEVVVVVVGRFRTRIGSDGASGVKIHAEEFESETATGVFSSMEVLTSFAVGAEADLCVGRGTLCSVGDKLVEPGAGISDEL